MKRQQHPVRVSAVWIMAMLLAGCQSQASQSPPSAPVVFRGMCDASGAIPLSAKRFVIADDEDNVLRVYDVDAGGDPLEVYDLSAQLGLHPRPRKKPGMPPKAPPELDIEGATLYKGLAYWITSHGRSSSGKYRAERLHFFATTLGDENTPIQVAGDVYETLLNDLIADPRMDAFRLAEAAEKAPKEPGGLNIEGLTARREGGVWIGFRNPLPQEKALMVALLNPEEVIHGKAARFSEPHLLDLDGKGIRALSSWRGRYLIAAGAYAGDEPSTLYTWDGVGKPKRLRLPYAHIATPDAFFTPENRDEIMFFNDQGAILIDGVECKKLDDPSRKTFTGVWFRL
jgi:hypothetical protein